VTGFERVMAVGWTVVAVLSVVVLLLRVA